MAERTPLYMDINNVYSGDEMGLPNRDLISEGIVLATDMAVTAGAGNTVNIAAGAAWIVGDTDVVNQPTYRIINDATVNLGINPDPTNPRIVRVGMQINDAGFSGVLRNGVLTAIHGTPAVGPVAPAEPASFLTLATVLVPAAAASSAAYTFTDVRPRAKVGGGQAVSYPTRSLTQLYLTVAQSIPTGAGTTAIVWDGENFDDLNLHPAGANSTITIAQSGLYIINFDMFWTNVVGGDRSSSIMVNGTVMAGVAGPRDLILGTTLQSVTHVGVRGPGDTITAIVAQTSGGAINTGSGPAAGPIFSVARIA